jgi:hypothetical protein
MRRPSASNLSYFGMAIGARVSAYAHWVRYLLGSRYDAPEKFREELRLEDSTASEMEALSAAARSLQR